MTDPNIAFWHGLIREHAAQTAWDFIAGSSRLTTEKIEQFVEAGVITKEEIVKIFSEELDKLL